MLQKILNNRDGAVLVLVGLAFSLLVTAVGVAVDMSRSYLAQSRMASAVDAAILSATIVGDEQDPVQVANNYFLANFSQNSAAVTLEPGFPVWSPVFNAKGRLESLNGEARANVQTVILSVIGINNVPIAFNSQASRDAGVSPIEVVYVLDRSLSMLWQFTDNTVGSPNRIDDLRNSAITSINQLKELQDEGLDVRAGYVTFNGTGQLASDPDTGAITQVALTDDLDSLISGINSIGDDSVCGWTRTNDGSREGWKFLRDGQSFNTPRIRKVMILLSDGYNIHPNPSQQPLDNADQRALCRSMKQQNIEIYTVAYALSTAGKIPIGVRPDGSTLTLDPAQTDEALEILEECASDPKTEHFFDVTAPGQLVNAFDEINRQLVGVRLTR
jgi:Flp pilus assembly protein TadG